jgi:hypothetical protein
VCLFQPLDSYCIWDYVTCVYYLYIPLSFHLSIVGARQQSQAGSNVYVTWWERNQTMNEPVMRISNDNSKTFGEKIMLSEK